MRKVDGLSLIFIDFYVQVLTPRVNSNETLLQLSGNITLFTVSHIYTCVISKQTWIGTRCPGCTIYIVARLGMSRVTIYIVYNAGGRVEPCGNPACISLGTDISALTL
jgi:hypothetical protein